jgi:hypothetical protein
MGRGAKLCLIVAGTGREGRIKRER